MCWILKCWTVVQILPDPARSCSNLFYNFIPTFSHRCQGCSDWWREAVRDKTGITNITNYIQFSRQFLCQELTTFQLCIMDIFAMMWVNWLAWQSDWVVVRDFSFHRGKAELGFSLLPIHPWQDGPALTALMVWWLACYRTIFIIPKNKFLPEEVTAEGWPCDVWCLRLYFREVNNEISCYELHQWCLEIY